MPASPKVHTSFHAYLLKPTGKLCVMYLTAARREARTGVGQLLLVTKLTANHQLRPRALQPCPTRFIYGSP